MSRVSKQQIAEWIDNPVTIALWSLCNWECDAIETRSAIDAICPGNPQKTQEQLIDLATRLKDWRAFGNILNGHLQHELIHDDESMGKFYLVIEEYDEDSDEDQSGPE